MYNFERFTKKGSRSGGSWISYNKSGFLFSAGFCLRENVLTYTHVVLFYDKESVAVAFLFTSDQNSPGALKLIRGNRDSTASVSSRSFVNANDLSKSEYFGRKNPEKVNYEEVGELYVIKLQDKEEPKTESASEAS